MSNQAQSPKDKNWILMTNEQFWNLSIWISIVIWILGFGIYSGDYKNLGVENEDNTCFEKTPIPSKS